MGAYLYRTNPSLIARALVRRPDGETVECDIALYRYAYKPSWADRDFNRRMDFRTGVTASLAAWDRSDKVVPHFGIMFDDETNETYALRGRDAAYVPFHTRGQAVGLDDHDFAQYSDHEIVRWVRLPRGIKSKAARPAA